MDTQSTGPKLDSKALRTALGRFATGVTVITAKAADGQLLGMTANSFSALSLDPPLVIWSIRLVSGQMPAFRDAGNFAVNILSAEQRAISDHFARPAEDRFASVEWRPGFGGAPILGNVLASFECRTVKQFELGDHLLFVGEVEGFAYADGQPLIYGCGAYGVPAALEAAA